MNESSNLPLHECMRIQIVEDISTIAARIERLIREILCCHDLEIQVSTSLDCAQEHLRNSPIDLLFLDLNLHGENGFELLEELMAESFHTIVISAFEDQAITAFEHGVLDFIKKPFSKERLEKAIVRYLKIQESIAENGDCSGAPSFSGQTKFLSVRDDDATRMIPTERILHISGAGGYSEIHVEGGQTHIHCKSIGNLIGILPDTFERVHKSHIVQKTKIHNIEIVGDHKYQVSLESGIKLPVSRDWYRSKKVT